MRTARQFGGGWWLGLVMAGLAAGCAKGSRSHVGVKDENGGASAAAANAGGRIWGGDGAQGGGHNPGTPTGGIAGTSQTGTGQGGESGAAGVRGEPGGSSGADGSTDSGGSGAQDPIGGGAGTPSGGQAASSSLAGARNGGGQAGGDRPGGGAVSPGGSSATSPAGAGAGGVSVPAGGAGGVGGAPRDLLTNGDMEDGTTHWTCLGGCTLQSVDIPTHSGEAALWVSGRSESWMGPSQSLLGLAHPGDVIEVSAWILVLEPISPLKITLRHDIGGAETSTTVAEVGVEEGTSPRWVQVSGTIEIPAGSTPSMLSVTFEGAAANADLYVDDAVVRLIVDGGQGGGEGPGGAGGEGGAGARGGSDPGQGGAGGAGRRNLFENGDMEDGTVGWSTLGGCALSTVDHPSREGSALWVSERGDDWQGPRQSLLGEVHPGDLLEVSGWVYVLDPSSPLRITLRHDIGGTTAFLQVAELAVEAITEPAWVLISGSVIVPSGSDPTALDVYFEGPASGVDMYLDDATAYVTPAGTGGEGGGAGASATGGAGGTGEGPGNLFINGDMEDGTAGWSPLGSCTLASEDETTHAGLSLLVTNRTESWQGAAQSLLGAVFPGDELGVSGWVYVLDPTAPLQVTAHHDIGGDGSYAAIAHLTPDKEGWIQIAGTVTLPTGSDPTYFDVYFEGPPSGTDLYLDDAVAWVVEAGGTGGAGGETGAGGAGGATDGMGGVAGSSGDVGGATGGGAGDSTGTGGVTGGATGGGAGDSTGTGGVTGGTGGGAGESTGATAGSSGNAGEVSSGGSAGTVPAGGTAGVATGGEAGAATMGGSSGAGGADVLAFNLLGNGDAELGTAGWQSFGSTVTQTELLVHGGTYSILGAARQGTWAGPAYLLPSGQAEYQISLFALQASGTDATLTLSAATNCAVDGYPKVAEATAPSGVWTELSGTLSVGGDCTKVQLYVQGPASTVDIIVDDLQAFATSVVNLAGNEGGELGTDGWQGYGTGVSQSDLLANSGSYSLLSSGRTADWNGVSYLAPTGAGEYSASVMGLHAGAESVTLKLGGSLRCNGVNTYPTLDTASVAGNTWVELSGSYTVPAGCEKVELVVAQSGGTIFPDVYADDLLLIPGP